MAKLFALGLASWALLLVLHYGQRRTLQRLETTLYTVQSALTTLGVTLMAKFDDLTAQVTALNDGLTAVMAAVTESGTDIDTILANVNPTGGLTEAEATQLVNQIAAVQTKQAEALAQAQAVAAKFPVPPPPV